LMTVHWLGRILAVKPPAFGCIAGSMVLSIIMAGAAIATPSVNGATIETRTFNDCPLSILTTVNNYPASIEITDEMNPACLGFANLHSFSLSEDGGTTAAVFSNDASFRFGADFMIDGPGEGEGGCGSRRGGPIS
jgi:hypothetical protein